MEGKKYDLEDRTTNFAIQIIYLCKRLQKNNINNPLISQTIRSSGSIGANYREANDALGKKDFIHRLKISRKETKETIHWLILLKTSNSNYSKEIDILIQEASEIRNILSSIITKTTQTT